MGLGGFRADEQRPAGRLAEYLVALDLGATDGTRGWGCSTKRENSRMDQKTDEMTDEELFEISFHLHMGEASCWWTSAMWAIHRLPTDVREFVFEKCYFETMDGMCGTVFRSSSLAYEWVILLGEPPDGDMFSEDSIGIVAHEIAHAFLGHDSLAGMAGKEVPPDHETQACALAAQWGFTGKGIEDPHAGVRGSKRH